MGRYRAGQAGCWGKVAGPDGLTFAAWPCMLLPALLTLHCKSGGNWPALLVETASEGPASLVGCSSLSSAALQELGGASFTWMGLALL